MSRMTPFSNPLLLGFDSVERTLERLQKSGDGYPPYNIERIHAGAGDDRIQTDAGGGDTVIRITLALSLIHI